jgi:hypothetical protein
MKMFIVLLVVCLPLLTSAQVQQGRSFLSGGFGLNTNSPDNPQPGSTKQFTRFEINAMYGYLVGETWAIGITPSLVTQTQTFYDDSKNHSNSFGIGPFVRKYFECSDKFYFHLDAMYSFMRQKDSSETSTGDNGPETKTTTHVIGLVPGASYFITDRVALQATIGRLAFSKFKGANDNDSSAFDFNFSITSFTLGAAVYF